MRFLLDTHSFIWWSTAPEKLSLRAFEVCGDDGHNLLLSVVSVWEIQIKVKSGKLQLGKPVKTLIAHQQESNDMEILPVTLQHVMALEALPEIHRDPFDRLLVAQAITEKISLISGDSAVAKYPVKVVW